MRHSFATALIVLALAVSATGVAPAAHAAGTIPAGNACIAGQEDCVDGLKCLIDANDNGYTCQDVGTTDIDPKAAETAAKIALDKSRTENASWGFGWIMSTIMSLFAWLVGVAALTLNYAMYYTVVDMGGYVKHLSAIGTVWKILRDIGNILLIFGFLAIGISIIIDSDWYGGGSKLLPKLLIVAVFANFSLFAAEAMIDVGNLFATQIYKQINEGKIPNPSDTSAGTGFAAVIQNKGIAGVLMNRLGLPSIYGGSKEVGTNGLPVFAGNSPWYMSFMSIIVFIVVAFVMFALAFILISRFIVLILLIMVSPVGVAGLVVPGLQGWANKWWDTLFHQTITAPILLLLLYIALSVIVDPGFLGFENARPAWNGIATNNFIGFAGILLSYLIAVGLLLAVVYFAKTLSAVGAGWATKTAGKLTFGTTGWMGRTSVGWLSTKAARGLRRTPIARIPLAGTGLVKGLEKVGGASFDVRGAKIGGGLKAAGISAGDAQKGGYKADLKARVESRTKYASELKGRESTDEEKKKIAIAQNELKALEKARANATAENYDAAHRAVKEKEEELAGLEEHTDKGAKRKYASNLELQFLGFKKDGFFNKNINFVANTEAAKKVREDAKKSSEDKELDVLRKALKKAGGEPEENGPKEKEKEEKTEKETPKGATT